MGAGESTGEVGVRRVEAGLRQLQTLRSRRIADIALNAIALAPSSSRQRVASSHIAVAGATQPYQSAWMDLSQLSEGEFLCEGARTHTPSNPIGFQLGTAQLQGASFVAIRSLGQGFELHQVEGQTGDVVLIRGGEIVGFYLGEVLEIDDFCRGLKLSVPMILEAVKERDPPTKRTVSKPGEAALRKAWRVVNGIEANPWP